ncbi:Reverse transcriptase (RNA-dependent DNA polymerase) [Nesidiocoris tenuis]|uniref:Reverse transcriptase (RNA-dependent DNA polymerase) n=1 Tax=Nesidiocoris tenuis TaxID=355587 RepID=A0ABN7ANK4_9HEMI|nr:Reverse transcriptase (RNA-dependent DNA polymerase) [Nesidiocoris tenuis]
MTSVVYNVSSSDDEDDIQIIRTRKSETLPNLPSVTIIKTVETTVKTTSVVNGVKKLAPTLLSSSVTLTKKSAKSSADHDVLPATALLGNSVKNEDAKTNKSAVIKPPNKTEKPIEEIVVDDSDNEIEWLGPVKNKVSSPTSEACEKNSTKSVQTKRKSTFGDVAPKQATLPTWPVRRKPLMIDLSLDDDIDDGEVTIIENPEPTFKATTAGIPKLHSNRDLTSICSLPEESISQGKSNDQQDSESHKQPIADSDEDDKPVVGNATESLLNKLIRLIEKVGFSQEAKKRVIRKITNYYSSSESNFTESQEFISSVGKLIAGIKDLIRQGPNKPMVVDEIAQKVREFLASLVRHTGKPEVLLNALPAPDYDPEYFLQNLPPPRTTFSFRPATVEEVFKIIMSMKRSKFMDAYGFNAEILAATAQFISEPLTSLINDCLELGVFPDILKISKVIPVHKTGPTNRAENFRPIALIPLLAKVFEKVLLARLWDFIDDLGILAEEQYGFRCGRTTQQAAAALVRGCFGGLEERKKVGAWFLDLSKAFDCLSPVILVEKLRHYGFEERATSLVQQQVDAESAEDSGADFGLAGSLGGGCGVSWPRHRLPAILEASL